MLLSEICGLVSIGRPLRREDGSAICSVTSSTSGKNVKKSKNRKYDDSYLDFGFTSTEVDGEERPQCVLCMKVLAS
jgi:hypothetical protein